MASFPNEVDAPVLKYKNNAGVIKDIKLFTTPDCEDAFGFLKYRTQPDINSAVYVDYFIPYVAVVDANASEVRVRVAGTTYALRSPGRSIGAYSVLFDGAISPVGIGSYKTVDFTISDENNVASDVVASYNARITMYAVPWGTKARGTLERTDANRGVDLLNMEVKSPWRNSGTDVKTLDLLLPNGNYKILFKDFSLVKNGTYAKLEVWL